MKLGIVSISWYYDIDRTAPWLRYRRHVTSDDIVASRCPCNLKPKMSQLKALLSIAMALLVYEIIVWFSRDFYEPILVGKVQSREIGEKCASRHSLIIMATGQDMHTGCGYSDHMWSPCILPQMSRRHVQIQIQWGRDSLKLVPFNQSIVHVVAVATSRVHVLPGSHITSA